MGKSWGRVSVGKKDNGDYEVILENSKMFCRYAGKYMDEIYQSPMCDLVIKDVNINIVEGHPGCVDAAAWRSIIKNAFIIRDDEFKKTVRIEWGAFKGPESIQEISIFKDTPYIHVKYIDWFVNSFDIPVADNDKDNWEYRIYGQEDWKRGFIFHEDAYYNTYKEENKVIELDEPGSLDYKGYFIMGLYNKLNDIGFGRVTPVKQTDIFKLLWKRGFELFCEFQKFPHPSVDGYIFIVTKGAEEIIKTGKEIVDGLIISNK
ncbi:MAG: hypothetical protein FIA99_11160 [Ruminiclostridium sp.]|nr:hypothetical protein [Ruminiclostridium sp.]